MDEDVRKYLEVHGGKAEDVLNRSLGEWYRRAYYSLGIIFAGMNFLENSLSAFKKALRYSKSVKHRLATQSWINRIKVLKSEKPINKKILKGIQNIPK